jgi:hypothetical protein
MLSKRTLAGLLPLVAVVAFAMVPAMAQASPEFLVNGAKFTGSLSVKSHGTKTFTLETAGGGSVSCTTLTDEGTLTGGSPGTGLSFLTFTGCSSPACPSPNVVTVDEFHVTFTLLSTTDADFFLLPGEPPLVLCNGLLLGEVTETTAGAGFLATVSGKKFVFSKAGNLTFAGEAATITGEDEQEGLNGEVITVS